MEENPRLAEARANATMETCAHADFFVFLMPSLAGGWAVHTPRHLHRFVLEESVPMKISRCFAGLLLGALLTVSPALADNPIPPSPTTPEITAPSAPIADLFTPAPVNKYGWISGPCSVTVTCFDGHVLRCGGLANCYWRYDANPPLPLGFVECDRNRIYCTRELN
jgi:hypothetical protein